MFETLTSPFAAVFVDTGFWLPALVTLVAGLMRGFAGFGSAMLMAPIFALLFGSLEMVATVMLIEFAVGLQLFPAGRRDADWSLSGPMSVAACLAMPVGVWLLASVDKGLIVKTVSGIIVLFVVVTASGWSYAGPRSRSVGCGVAAISGMMMATTSVGGPPVLMYLLSGKDPPARHRGNIIGYYMATQVPLLAIMYWSGVAGMGAFWRALALLPFMILGAWIGRRLFDPARERLYRNVALAVLFCAGAGGLLRDVPIR